MISVTFLLFQRWQISTKFPLLTTSDTRSLSAESYKWLKRNVTLNSSNKVRLSDRVDCFNLDGRDFLRQVVIPDVARRIRQEASSAIAKREFHVVMNLPAIAIEFLDVLPGCMGEEDLSSSGRAEGGEAVEEEEEEEEGKIPDFFLTVYCYCFSKAEDVVGDTRERVEAVLGTTLTDDACQIRDVRNVAPNKMMMLAKLSLNSQFLRGNSEPLPKRQRLC